MMMLWNCRNVFKMGTRGLTLIELLVVLLILAVLGAILLPLFSTAQAAGRRSACISHLKQIGAALQCYADDYAGRLPDCVKINPYEPSNPRHYAHDWPEKLHMKLQPYARNREVFRCPGDRFPCAPYPKPGTRADHFTIFEAFGSSYQNYAEGDCYQKDNSPVLGRMQSDLYGMPWPVPLSHIPKPSKTRLVRDAIPYHIRTGGSGAFWHWNELFADGHVETVKSSESRAGDPNWGFSYDTGGIL